MKLNNVMRYEIRDKLMEKAFSHEVEADFVKMVALQHKLADFMSPSEVVKAASVAKVKDYLATTTEIQVFDEGAHFFSFGGNDSRWHMRALPVKQVFHDAHPFKEFFTKPGVWRPAVQLTSLSSALAKEVEAYVKGYRSLADKIGDVQYKTMTLLSSFGNVAKLAAAWPEAAAYVPEREEQRLPSVTVADINKALGL